MTSKILQFKRLSDVLRFRHIDQNLDLVILVFNQGFKAFLCDFIWSDDFGDHATRFQRALVHSIDHFFEVTVDVRNRCFSRNQHFDG